MIVSVDRFERVADLMPRIEATTMGDFPGALVIANAYILGPGGGSDIEARLRGEGEELIPMVARAPAAREWGGEYESASETMAALAGTLSPTLILMMLIVSILFNALRGAPTGAAANLQPPLDTGERGGDSRVIVECLNKGGSGWRR
jgi:hypothetical protein